MKTRWMLAVLISLLALMHETRAFDGSTRHEFRILKAPGNSSSLSVTITSIGFAWTWNSNQVVLASQFNQTYSNIIDLTFDAPKSAGGGAQGIIPWALMHFSVSVGGGSAIEFNMNILDEDWSTNAARYAYPDVDLYVESDGGMYFKVSSLDPVNVVPNATNYIWDAYHTSNDAAIANFDIPVTLKNIVNGGLAGGTLTAGGTTVNSGDPAGVQGPIATPTIATNNERFENYQGSGITHKHNNWNQALADFLLSRAVILSYSNIQQEARFVLVKACTIRAEFSGTVLTSSDGATVQFKDPWYKHSDETQPNTFFTYNSPFSPSGAYGVSSLGVFLNQSGPPNWNFPYYSVSTSSTFNYNLLKLVFDHWSSPNGKASF